MTESLLRDADLPERKRDPRCRDACTTRNRPSFESPASFGKERGTGRKLVYCPCCNHELHSEESLRSADTQVIANVRPPNLNPALQVDRHRRFVDLICGYEVVVLWDITEVK